MKKLHLTPCQVQRLHALMQASTDVRTYRRVPWRCWQETEAHQWMT